VIIKANLNDAVTALPASALETLHDDEILCARTRTHSRRKPHIPVQLQHPQLQKPFCHPATEEIDGEAISIVDSS
jgi:hypothetical protein